MNFLLFFFSLLINALETTTTTKVSICSPSLLVTSIDPPTGNEFVRPCPAPSPCQCLCQIENQRLWIDCFHRQLTTVPHLTAVSNVWNIDLSFNRFENLSVDQHWIPQNLRLQSVILSGDLAYDLIVQLNLNHRHLIEHWEDQTHLLDGDNDDSPGQTRRFLTELTSKLRGKSQSIRSFDLSLAGDDPFPSISILYLDHNLLDSVPLFALYNATTLEELYLSSNRLTSVPAFAFGFSHRLTRLDLSNNRITSLDPRTFDRHPQAFAGPFLIDYLDLSSNLLVHLHPAVFSYLVNLRLLKLQHNRIRSLSAHVWTGLYRLKYLDLSHNQLQNFSRVFYNSYLSELNQLKLSSNNISRLEPCEFLSLKSLTKLDLSQNRLTDFDFCTFYGLEPSVHLHLRSNAFESFHPCPLYPFARSTIHIDNNPLTCNCSFNYLLQDRQSIVYTGDECRAGFSYHPHSQFYQTAVRKTQRKPKKKFVNSSNTCRQTFKHFQHLCSKSDCRQSCFTDERLIIQISTIATPSRLNRVLPSTFLFLHLLFVINHRIGQEL